MNTTNPMQLIFSVLGGPSKVARICGVAPITARKWRERGHLPRTEWTGETHYAEKIETATNGMMTRAQLLAHCPTTRGFTPPE